MASRTVSVGGTDYTLRPFKAYKAIIAGELISRVGKEIQTLLESLREYEREYRAKNVIRFTRAQTLTRRWDFPPEAFVTPEDGGESYIDLPGMPSQEERLMFAFPAAFRLAKDEVQKLLALVVVGDDELRVADRSSNVDEALETLGERLLYEGEIGEIVELMAAAIDHVREQLEPHKEAVGKLRDFFRRTSTPDPMAKEDEEDDRNRELKVATVIPPSPESSISSEAPTDGPEREPSLASPGERSSA